MRGLTISPDNVLGIQTGTFTVQFSRPMNPGIPPSLVFYTAGRGTWSQYTSANSSLPANTVNAIATDFDGNPWFGTPANGAAYRVGSKWTLYNAANSSLPSNAVNAIASDMDGSTWFGTTDGAARLSGGMWDVYTTTTSLPVTTLAITADPNRAKYLAQPKAWLV